MHDLETVLRVILVVAALAAFTWVLVRLVRRAKRGGKGLHAIGAVLMTSNGATARLVRRGLAPQPLRLAVSQV